VLFLLSTGGTFGKKFEDNTDFGKEVRWTSDIPMELFSTREEVAPEIDTR
jgi:hypothetical protein